MRPVDSQTPARFSFLIPFWALSIGFLRAARIPTRNYVGSSARPLRRRLRVGGGFRISYQQAPRPTGANLRVEAPQTDKHLTPGFQYKNLITERFDLI